MTTGTMRAFLATHVNEIVFLHLSIFFCNPHTVDTATCIISVTFNGQYTQRSRIRGAVGTRQRASAKMLFNGVLANLQLVTFTGRRLAILDIFLLNTVSNRSRFGEQSLTMSSL